MRGHTVGHLLSSLAISYANTGDPGSKATGAYLVGELAKLQRAAPLAGYSPGYLSAFPEEFFDWLEAGQTSKVWSPYYMIHKYLAGMIDQYELAGCDQAIDVATRLADWVDRRTAPLSYAHMQRILAVEYGGLPESLVNLYAITGAERYLTVAQRFYHARFLDPLAAGKDDLAGEQCNVNTPKILAALRMWEVTGDTKYRDIAENFWQFAAGQHSYVIGGQGNHEHWDPPGVIAAALSNYTCEGCVTYNMLKLTRLLHFHDQARTDVLDYYERALFNQMLGVQDPDSPHGFTVYYTGLSAGAVKQQPLNYFPQGNPDAYATDYDTFTCDTATELETQAKFADTIYSRDSRGVYVNLFIPSEVRCADHGVTHPPGDRLPGRPPGAAHRDQRFRHDDPPGAGAVLGRRAARGRPQRCPAAGNRRGRLDHRPAALAAGRPAGGHAAHAAGVPPRARRSVRAGGQLRPGRSRGPRRRRRLRGFRRRDRRHRQRRHPGQHQAPRRGADRTATALVAAARRRVRPPHRRPADGVHRDGRRPSGDPGPGGPRKARAIHRLLADQPGLGNAVLAVRCIFKAP